MTIRTDTHALIILIVPFDSVLESTATNVHRQSLHNEGRGFSFPVRVTVVIIYSMHL